MDEVKTLLAELHLEGRRRLLELYEQITAHLSARGQYTPLEQLRLLLIQMSEQRKSYRIFAWQKDVPWTNNCTEQVIDRMKMRACTVRGDKSWQWQQAGLLLSGTDLEF